MGVNYFCCPLKVKSSTSKAAHGLVLILVSVAKYGYNKGNM